MRPLRSLMLGDTDHYLSPYIHGVAQGMARLGHLHSSVSIRQPAHVIQQRILDVRPDVLWTHMLLWAPAGAPATPSLLALVDQAARAGSRVVIHDGDYKPATRHPESLTSWCSLALANHTFDRSAWKVPVLRWPYFAFDQDSIAAALPELACDLFFAGTLGGGPVYGERTRFIAAVQHDVDRRARHRGRRGFRLSDPNDGNTLLRTAELAASAGAVLGCGRPGVDGWVDTRVFQYTGAGAILLHDDAAGYLEPWVHFAPYTSGDAGSVIEALERIEGLGEAGRAALRMRAFHHCQAHHSASARVRQVLEQLFGRSRA